MNYKVERQTCLHGYATDLEKLTRSLEMIEEQGEKIHMAYILLKNKQGKSPLDIALDQESPKSVEAMLMRLHHINEYNVSRAIYKRFPEFFKMQIRAFDNFLEGCFF